MSTRCKPAYVLLVGYPPIQFDAEQEVAEIPRPFSGLPGLFVGELGLSQDGKHNSIELL